MLITTRFLNSIPSHCLRLALCIVFFAQLTGCGGGHGFEPVVTAVKLQSLQYGRVATIFVGGKDLRSTLIVDSEGACENVTIAPNSSTELLGFNCRITSVGTFALRIKGQSGEVLYSAAMVVPKPQVKLITNLGDITLELEPAAAAATVNNFLSYVYSNYYAGTLFHRVIPGFVIQGGGYSAGMLKKQGQMQPIMLESNKGLSNSRGTLAMARTSVFNSATSEFFINLVNNTSLDYQNQSSPGYAVFGAVIEGMAVVDAIAAQPTGFISGSNDVPLVDSTVILAIQVK